MSDFDLTPEFPIVPPINQWQRTPAEFPLAELWKIHLEAMQLLQSDFHLKVRLSPIDVYSNVFRDNLLSEISAASWPLNDVLQMKTTIPHLTPDWLSYWELYYKCLYDALSAFMESKKNKPNTDPRKEEYKSKGILKDIPFRSFHIADNSGVSLNALNKTLNKIDYYSSVSINWQYLATFTNGRSQEDRIIHEKSKQHWLRGVDGEGRVTLGNMRAWQNQIKTKLKTVDCVISHTSEDTPYVLAFALLNLAPSGYAICYIPKITDAATISFIYLFSQVFEKTMIYHMVATDKMYLCGQGYNVLGPRERKLVLEWCEDGSRSVSLFTVKLMESKPFLDILEKLMHISEAVYTWRYDYYEKLFKTFITLSHSAAAEQFADYTKNMLATEYKDISKRWIAATGFDYTISK